METREKYRKREHKSMVVAPKAIPPTIPLKKVLPNSYTGKGKDIPGPANYNPNLNVVKKKNRASDFTKLNKSREVFSNKSGDYPGPGIYDYNQDMGHKTMTSFNSSGLSPMFMSKVPNCKGTKDDNGIPGPGSYIEKKKKKNLHQRSHSYRLDPSGKGFLSSTRRDESFKSDGPGPGNYHNTKKKVFNKNKFSDTESAKPGFHSTGTRECLKQHNKAQSPGPGQYIDMASTHFMANNNSSKYNSERGLGSKASTAGSTHFGSKSMRFAGGMFKQTEYPGPGQYFEEKDPEENQLQGILTKAQINKQGKEGAVFSSTTNRFLENVPDNPNVRILDKKKDRYTDLVIGNSRHQPSNTQYEGIMKPSRRVGFTATSPRFTHNQVFYGEKLKYTPGPGDYTFINNLRPQTYSHSRSKGRKQIFSSSEMKFPKGFNSYISKHGTNNGVGPGSYISTD